MRYENLKYVIVSLLCFTAIFFVAIFIIKYAKIQPKITAVQQPAEKSAKYKEKQTSSMDENETIRYLMTQIYRSDKFVSDEAEQLPNMQDENVKNRLLWKPTQQELDAHPDWIDAFKYSLDSKVVPAGYFVAFPMLLHIYDDQDATYAFMFSQSATRGNSHVSGSDMGAGVFKKENDVWKPIFLSKNINNGFGAFGDAGRMSPIRIGENKYAYKNELTNMGQGSISNHKILYYFNGKTFNIILDTIASGSDGTDCLSKNKDFNGWEETVNMRTEQVQNSDFYDLILEWGGTKPENLKGECHIVPEEKRIETYHWDGIKYELVR